MTQAEIDEALAQSDEINELQNTRILAAAYRREKKHSDDLDEECTKRQLRIYQLEAERDAAAESCRLLQDRVERLVEANLGLREAALAYADLATCYRLGKAPSEGLFHRLDMARAALGKEEIRER